MRADRQDDTVLVSLPASLSGSQATELREIVDQHAEQPGTKVVLDASALTFIDSTAIGLLVKCLQKLKSQGGTIAFWNLQGEVFDFFQETCLDAIFSIKKGEIVQEPRDDALTPADDKRLHIQYETTDEAAVLHLKGEMNHRNSIRALRAKTLEAMADAKRLVLDMEELKYVDSSSIAEIVNLNRILKSSNGELCMCRPSKTVSDLLQTLGTSKIIPVFPSLDQAISR